MLILGIDTATDQVSAAIGGHEGVLGSVNVARGRRHAETLAPAIDFLRQQTGVGLDELGVVAVDVGPGLFTGLRVGVATAKAMAYALRIPMIGVPSLDLVAFPQRLTSRLIVAAIDARRGEVFYAFYRSVPAGVQRVTPHQVGTPSDLASEIVATGEECLVVGDGARRYLDVFDGLSRVLVADQDVAHPTAAALVQLAHAQALREQFVKPWELEPLYLRKPDAVANWTSRTVGRVVIDPASLPTPAADVSGALEIAPMRRRHLRSVIRIEVQSYPRPWSLGLYLSELALGSLRCYLVARRGGEVVGYGGVMYIGPDADVTTLAVAPEFHRQGIGGRVLLHLARASVAHGAENLTLEVRVTNEPAIELYRRFGFAPAGVRKNYYAEINEDALVMWANDINTPDYTARLDRLAVEMGMPAGGWPPVTSADADVDEGAGG